MLAFTQSDLRTIGEQILSMEPEPVPRYRLLRDVFKRDESDAEYRKAKADLDASRWVRLLAESQQADGTWGRFHTQDTKIKQPFPTTQAALRVALDCGLDQTHPVIRRLLPTLLDYVEGKYLWPDWAEKHDNPAAWPIWVRHYSAAELSTIDRYHPALDEFWRIRAESLEEAFSSGVYDREAEVVALNRLLVCRMKRPVPCQSEPSVKVIVATRNRLPEHLERRVIEFLLTAPRGIYYTCETPLCDYPAITDRRVNGWLRANALMSGFPVWREFLESPYNHLWAQRNEDGLWDVGGAVPRKPFSSFPLSDSWRRRANRVIDSTVQILSLLSTARD